jgi:hypothetical protein
MDPNTTSFPFNRQLIKINVDKILKNKPKCEVFFWLTKQFIRFDIDKKTGYYSFSLTGEDETWKLFLLSVYPWTD